MKFHCQKCLQFDSHVLLKKIIEDKQHIIDSKDEIISLLRKKIEDLERSQSHVYIGKPTYSQTLQAADGGNVKSNMITGNVPSLIIKPKTRQNSQKTKFDIQRNIKPADLKVAIRSTRATSDGGMIVKCQKKEDLEVLRGEVENKLENYEVSVPKMRKPRIKITGYKVDCEKYLEGQQIEACIREQNNFVDDSDHLHVTYMRENKRNGTYTIYCECSSVLFRKFMNFKKVFIQWERYPVYEDISIPRCFNCQEYYHKSSTCSKKTVCGYCSEEHNFHECPKKQRRCNNCVGANSKFKLSYDVGHESGSLDCPTYQYFIKIMRSKVDYDGVNGL